MGSVQMIFVFLRALFPSQAGLAAENLALRQQLAVLSEQKNRPRLRRRDRIFWVWLSRLSAGWRLLRMQRNPEYRPSRRG